MGRFSAPSFSVTNSDRVDTAHRKPATAFAAEHRETTMKISKALVLFAGVAALTACGKGQPDTATPADATPAVDAPTDVAADDVAGEEEGAGEEEATEEEGAEEGAEEEAAE